MASGFFLGGMAQGFQNEQKIMDAYQFNQKRLQLEQQSQDAQQRREQQVRIDKLAADAWAHIEDSVNAFRNSGASPQDTARAVTPLLDQVIQMQKLNGMQDAEAIYRGYLATSLAGPSQAQNARTLAQAKEEPGLAAERKARAGYYDRGGAPVPGASVTPANPTNPDLDTDTALGGTHDKAVAGSKFLSGLSEDRRNNALAVYEGRTPLTAFSTRTYRGAQKSQRQQAIEDAEQYGQLVGKPFDARQIRADTNSLTKLTQSRDAIQAFEDTAVANGDVLVDLAKKVDKTGVPVAERWLRAGRQAIEGDTDVSNFNLQLQLYRNEVAKILTNPNLTGQLTDTARGEIEKALQDGATWQQIQSAHNLLKGDFSRRTKALDSAIDRAKKRSSAQSGSSASDMSDDDLVKGLGIK